MKPKFEINQELKYMTRNMFNSNKEENHFIVKSVHKFKESYRYIGLNVECNIEQWVEEERLYK